MALPKYIEVEFEHNQPTWYLLSKKIAEFNVATMWASHIEFSSATKVVKIRPTRKLITKLKETLS